MMRRLVTLTLNDLAVSFKNKTVYLMIFIPLFVFFSLTVVDRPDGRVVTSRIGLIQGQAYPKNLVSSLQGSGTLFSVTWLSGEADGRKQLLERAVDGVLLPVGAESAVLLVSKKGSIKTLAVMESLAKLQRAVEARDGAHWISDVATLEKEREIQYETLPIWILMMVLLVAFLVVTPQIAEEKEKKLLLGLLQTPMREGEWLLAKILMSMTLAVGSMLILHCVSRLVIDQASSYLVFLIAGSFCFSSMGILLGFLCRTQASARALGVVVYLPHLLPSALSDFSTKLNAVAKFVPSYQFFVPVKAILMEGSTAEGFSIQLSCLIVVGLSCCGATLALLKRRWLM